MGIITTLAVLVAAASTSAGMPCATIENTQNRAAFKVPGKAVVSASYADYGDSLGYSRPIPRKAWAATRKAERKLGKGKPGAKRVTACARPMKRDLR